MFVSRLVLAFSSLAVALSARPFKWEYGLLIESSPLSTHLTVYEWQERHSDDGYAPVSQPKWIGQSADATPGIAECCTSVEEVTAYLRPLLDFAEETLSQHKKQWLSIPIFFRASGALRLLTKHARHHILGLVREVLADESVHAFYFEESYAQVLAGNEQAALNWVTLNFLEGFLNGKTGEQYWGALHLDEVSADIAWKPKPDDVVDDLSSVRLFGDYEWRLYAHSFLQYGTETIEQRLAESAYAAALAEEGSAPPVLVANPCLFSGDLREYQINGESVAQSGGSWEGGCRPALKALLGDTFCPTEPCAFLGVHLAPHGEEDLFVASGLFPTVARALGFQDMEQVSMRAFSGRAADVCALSWGELRNSTYYSSGSESAYRLCLLATHVSVLLQDGFGFQGSHELRFASDLHRETLGWAQGAATVLVDALPYRVVLRKCDEEQDHTYEYVTIALGASIAVFAFGFLAYFSRRWGVFNKVSVSRAKTKRRGYQETMNEEVSQVEMSEYDPRA